MFEKIPPALIICVSLSLHPLYFRYRPMRREMLWRVHQDDSVGWWYWGTDSDCSAVIVNCKNNTCHSDVIHALCLCVYCTSKSLHYRVWTAFYQHSRHSLGVERAMFPCFFFCHLIAASNRGSTRFDHSSFCNTHSQATAAEYISCSPQHKHVLI